MEEMQFSLDQQLFIICCNSIYTCWILRSGAFPTFLILVELTLKHCISAVNIFIFICVSHFWIISIMQDTIRFWRFFFLSTLSIHRPDWPFLYIQSSWRFAGCSQKLANRKDSLKLFGIFYQKNSLKSAFFYKWFSFSLINCIFNKVWYLLLLMRSSNKIKIYRFLKLK